VLACGAVANEELKQLLATGTRILYEHGLVDAYGHLSYRLPGTDRFLINPRRSPALLSAETVLTMTLDGEVVDGDDRPNSEWHIHGSIYRARPDVLSVCHAHTDMSILFSMAPVGLRPMFGNGSPSFGADPLPVYPFPKLIRDRERGDRLASALGDRRAVLLRGHGCAVTGASVQDTVLRTLELERNGKLMQQIMAMGKGEPRYWTAEEIDEWRSTGEDGSPNQRAWEYYTTRPIR
jgi:ribulose-5-phosphate 4-epimerase/fuculose-1-phosphate aldolase